MKRETAEKVRELLERIDWFGATRMLADEAELEEVDSEISGLEQELENLKKNEHYTDTNRNTAR